MNEISCPVCNRVNNADAERCWYCQALLHNKTQGDTFQRKYDANVEPESSSPEIGEQTQGSSTNQAVPAEEIPEWLARIRARKLADQGGLPIQNKPQPAQTSSGAPDWLKEMGGADIPDLIPQPEQVEDTLDATAPGLGKSQLLEASDDEEIDWLKDLGSDQDAIGVEETAKTSGNNQFPVTLNGTDDHLVSGQFESVIEQEVVANNISDKGGTEPSVSFDWAPTQPLSDTQEPGLEAFVETNSSSAEIPEGLEFEGSVLRPPDWFSCDEISEELEINKDLLGNEPLQFDQSLTINESQKTTQEEIPPELAALSSEGGGSIGILDGIEGVLQGGGVVKEATRRRDYTGGLNATQRQLSQAAIFGEILKGGKVDRRASESFHSLSIGMKIIKALLVLVLLAAVILPNLMTPINITPPALYPAELISTISIIQNLPTDRPVLLVANFEAGLAGEMSLVTESLVEHLVSRRIPISLLSTNAVGSAALPDLVIRVASQNGSYPIDTHLMDIGYLSGGVIAFQALVNDLRGTLPFSANLDPVWVNPIMQSINRLADFGAVILISDDAEISRAWIEQVGIHLEGKPLLLVLSAQAAPMVQPYFASGQVTGFIAGETQGLLYESLRGYSGHAARLYSGFQPVLILSAIAIFIGGIVSLVTYSSPLKRKEKKPDVA